MSLSADPPSLDLNSESVRQDPYPVYRWFRENDPVHRLEPRQPGGVVRYLVTRWEDVEAGLKLSALKRTVHAAALWNQDLAQVPPEFLTYAKVTREWPLFRDPPRHAAARRPINRILDEPPDAPVYRELLEGVIDRVLAELAPSHSFDAVEAVARRVPLEFDLVALGITDHSAVELGRELEAIGLALGNVFDGGRIARASLAMDVIGEWIVEAMARPSASPGEAPFRERLAAMAASGAIQGREQLIAAGILLLQAAQDTTSSLIANGIYTLLRHPHHLAALTDDAALRAVVEEVLRYESPVQQITRHAAEPVTIRGVQVTPGEGVSFLLGAANRDPAVFEAPELFDPTIPRHGTAAFGFGPHTCPGSALARQTAGMCWRKLFARMPDLQLEEGPVKWRPTVTFRSIAVLPLRAAGESNA